MNKLSKPETVAKARHMPAFEDAERGEKGQARDNHTRVSGDSGGALGVRLLEGVDALTVLVEVVHKMHGCLLFWGITKNRKNDCAASFSAVSLAHEKNNGSKRKMNFSPKEIHFPEGQLEISFTKEVQDGALLGWAGSGG
jgi:hypothetical protein